MFKRILSPMSTKSFFLFGARGTGKSTWLERQFEAKHPFFIDLLDPDQEDRYSRNPKALELDVLDKIKKNVPLDWVILDEVQKAPKLLDVVHRLIEKKKLKFVLTGSSARKLKRGHANLLGGRALVYSLFPLSYQELGGHFNLDFFLRWGSLPAIVTAKNDRERLALLRSYKQTYLKEEVLVEQLVRNLVPFKNFIEIAAQMNAERLNYENIAVQINVDNKTVQNYFEILEETYLGIRLPAYHHSIRKSQLLSPKFYWFDLGVKRFLTGEIRSEVARNTFTYGREFETFIINEIWKLISYRELDYQLSYLQTKNGPEIDLILTRGKEKIAIEIKSNRRVDEKEVKIFEDLASDLPGTKKLYYLSHDPHTVQLGTVLCLPWQRFLEDLNS
ncbi:MAG: ATP-binding protein [Deltaproteobacteria bacterium]|nr:ATP-binding protein [Deltaproteobacteria bacterium]